MKARIEKDKVQTYSKLPSVWNGIVGFQYATEEQLIANGFYDLVTPALLVNEKLGTPYIDTTLNIITYNVDTIPPKTQTEIDAELATTNDFIFRSSVSNIFNRPDIQLALIKFLNNGTKPSAELKTTITDLLTSGSL